MIHVTLSDAERSELAERLRDRGISVETQARLRMAELSDRGASPPRIAHAVGRHENAVRKLLKRFQAERFAALAKRTAPGRAPRAREEHWLALEAMLDGSARAFTSRQMAAWLQERFGLSVHPRYLAQRLKINSPRSAGGATSAPRAAWPTRTRTPPSLMPGARTWRRLKII